MVISGMKIEMEVQVIGKEDDSVRWLICIFDH